MSCTPAASSGCLSVPIGLDATGGFAWGESGFYLAGWIPFGLPFFIIIKKCSAKDFYCGYQARHQFF
jgi:hypothetical protein